MGTERGSLVKCSELGCGRLHLPGPKYHHQHRLIYHIKAYYKSAEYVDHLGRQGPAPPSEAVQGRLKARLAARRPAQPRIPLPTRDAAPNQNHSDSSASEATSKASSLPSTLKSSSFKKPNVAKPLLSSDSIISALLDKATQRTPPTSSGSSRSAGCRAPSPVIGRPPPPSVLVEERGSKEAAGRKRSHDSDDPRGEEGGAPAAKRSRGLRAEDGTLVALQTLAFAKTSKGQMEVTLATQEGLDDLLSHLSITSALVLRHCGLLQLIPAAGRPIIATRTKFAPSHYQRRPQVQGRDRRRVQGMNDAYNEPALRSSDYEGRLAQRVTYSHRMDETLGRFQAGGDRTASNRLQDLAFLALQPSSSNPLPFHHTHTIAQNEVKETIIPKHPFFGHALDSFRLRKKNQQWLRQRITYVDLSPDDYANISHL